MSPRSQDIKQSGLFGFLAQPDAGTKAGVVILPTIFGVNAFARGFAEFRILVDQEGSIEDMTFRPSGDDTPGGTVTCAQERSLKSLSGTAPIRRTPIASAMPGK